MIHAFRTTERQKLTRQSRAANVPRHGTATIPPRFDVEPESARTGLEDVEDWDPADQEAGAAAAT